MLIMPYSHDQPDNARRMKRKKVSRTIERGAYRPARVARTVRTMLAKPEYAEHAANIAGQIRREDGVRHACDALEELGKGR